MSYRIIAWCAVKLHNLIMLCLNHDKYCKYEAKVFSGEQSPITFEMNKYNFIGERIMHFSTTLQ